ncbi:MAG: hypothetical protein GSR84_06725 [Desulfurococcales archaeon]|nr:hypothetical protein [Desulfurococcales archaeon]
MQGKPALYTILFTLFSLLSITSYAVAFATLGLGGSLLPVSPGLVLGDPGLPQVYVTLSPSNTTGEVVVVASNRQQVIYNPDFYSSPDGWLCSPGSSLSCYWLPGDTGASGGVAAIGGNLPSLSSDSAFILQEVRMPDSGLNQVVMEARVRLSQGVPGLASYIVGVYDPVNSSLYYASGVLQSTYTVVSVNLTGYLEPGRNYYAVVGLYAVSLASYTVEMLIDWANLYVDTNESTYTGPLLLVNASERVYTSLTLAALDSPGGLDAEITLTNLSATSTPITIENSTVTSSSTSEIMLDVPPPGYTSGRINLTTSKVDGNHTLGLQLRYCTLPGGLGACVYYNITLVIDPPGPPYRWVGNPTPASISGARIPVSSLIPLEVANRDAR